MRSLVCQLFFLISLVSFMLPGFDLFTCPGKLMREMVVCILEGMIPILKLLGYKNASFAANLLPQQR